jgi:acetyl-CoA C-acetyltransferase
MTTPSASVIVAWGRSAVVPVGGALSQFMPHQIAAPVLQALLQRFAIPPQAIDTVIAGNALGAGGNPARMLALAAGLPDRVAALSVDTQCCAGLDAVTLAHALIAAGNAEVVIAGGVEAWSRAPLRQHRPRSVDELAVSYDSPAFAPDPARDPDMLLAAARHAQRAGITRAAQEVWTVAAHARAVAAQARLQQEIVAIGAACHDSYARNLQPRHLARMPLAAVSDATDIDEATREQHAISRIAVSPRADGAAFVVIASAAAAQRWGLKPAFAWRAGLTLGGLPETPMLTAIDASQEILRRNGNTVDDLWTVELHDAFAAQALAFATALQLPDERLNRSGGGLSRGHPIGASGAISLVQLLSDMQHGAPTGALGLTTIAAAGGIGAAALVTRC